MRRWTNVSRCSCFDRRARPLSLACSAEAVSPNQSHAFVRITIGPTNDQCVRTELEPEQVRPAASTGRSAAPVATESRRDSSRRRWPNRGVRATPSLIRGASDRLGHPDCPRGPAPTRPGATPLGITEHGTIQNPQSKIQNLKSEPHWHRHNHPVRHSDHKEPESHSVPGVSVELLLVPPGTTPSPSNQRTRSRRESPRVPRSAEP